MARSRSMVVQYKSKQMVGHLGTDINVMVSHGNNHTMRLTWRKLWEHRWDRHARHIRKFNVKFWCGDFNMSLTEVPKQLRSRGINADCCAWYPFKHINPGGSVHSEQRSSTPMGIDSLAIFVLAARRKLHRHTAWPTSWISPQSRQTFPSTRERMYQANIGRATGPTRHKKTRNSTSSRGW